MLALCNNCLLCCTRMVLASTWEILPRTAIKLLHWLEPGITRFTSVPRKSLASLYACAAACIPLFLLNRLLSESHVLHVLLESVEWGIWFDTNTIVMVFWVPSARHKQKRTHERKSDFKIKQDLQETLNVTLFQGALYEVPWRWSGWVCQKRLHLQDPVSAPGSDADNDCRGWIVVDLRPLLSRNYPTATEATREHKKFTRCSLLWMISDHWPVPFWASQYI